jgi:hypothetical protein
MEDSEGLANLVFNEIKRGIDALGDVRSRNLKRIVLLTKGIKDLVDTSGIVTPLCKKLDVAYPIKLCPSKNSLPEVDSGGALEVSVEDKDSYEFQEGDYSVELEFIYRVVNGK